MLTHTHAMANIFERRIDKILDLGLTDANGIILQLNNRFCDRDTCRWKLHNMDLIHSVINDLLFVSLCDFLPSHHRLISVRNFFAIMRQKMMKRFSLDLRGRLKRSFEDNFDDSRL